MRVGTLRSIISNAFYHEERTHCLERHLKFHIETLPDRLKIEKDNELESLKKFAMDYIHHVPEFLDALKEASQKAGIENHVFPFLRIAERYFISPPSLPNHHVGLMAMMDEAYLAHRLFEEVNDRYISRVGMPLIPWDMTLANVVAHQLVGEDLANRLDALVYNTVNKMMPAERHYESDEFKDFVKQEKGNTTSIWQEWPCMGKAAGIEWALS
ncbi:hypothetical protein QNI23_016805 [Bermanella sp. WJH001]|uniref:hypothetical protein n=1 Tax=Bermanella sp. WJH001 TaxID=3048005 RepID=UPI0024BE10EF|nr:hypothetical protein [Bermanella sp. WJH001]MDJ1538896.1 hypothetical protein [Bermanella sp. WJH001]